MLSEEALAQELSRTSSELTVMDASVSVPFPYSNPPGNILAKIPLTLR